MHKNLKNVVDRHKRRSDELSNEMKDTLFNLQRFINFMTKANRDNSILTFKTRLEALRLTSKICDTKSSRADARLDKTSLKTIKIFDKLVNYRHIGERLSRMTASSKFRHLFKFVQFKFLNCYESHRVKSRERFVHAEVQLVTFHRLQKTHSSSRTIKTSKTACYLCSLFLSLHPQYRISATHGVVFDAWTIPDVISYSAEDRKDLRDVVRSMQNTLEARAGKLNCRSLQFPIQSGIYQVPSLPSLAGTVISLVPPMIDRSYSIVQTGLSTQEAVLVPLVGSVEKAATIPLVDHHMELKPEIIIQTPNQKSVVVDEQHEEELRLQEKESLYQEPKIDESPKYERGAEPNEDFEPCTKANLIVDVVNSEVPGPEGIFTRKQDPIAAERIYEKDSNTDLKPIKDETPAVDKRHQSNKESDGELVSDAVSKPNDRPALDEKHVLSTERLQMPFAVVNSSNEPIIETIKISPHHNADDDADHDCESTAHISSDYSNKQTSAVRQADIAQEPSGEIEQKTPESSEKKRSRKKRRRRRHKIKDHH